jgi:hypothetical protein
MREIWLPSEAIAPPTGALQQVPAVVGRWTLAEIAWRR